MPLFDTLSSLISLGGFQEVLKPSSSTTTAAHGKIITNRMAERLSGGRGSRQPNRSSRSQKTSNRSTGQRSPSRGGLPVRARSPSPPRAPTPPPPPPLRTPTPLPPARSSNSPVVLRTPTPTPIPRTPVPVTSTPPKPAFQLPTLSQIGTAVNNGVNNISTAWSTWRAPYDARDAAAAAKLPPRPASAPPAPLDNIGKITNSLGVATGGLNVVTGGQSLYTAVQNRDLSGALSAVGTMASGAQGAAAGALALAGKTPMASGWGWMGVAPAAGQFAGTVLSGGSKPQLIQSGANLGLSAGTTALGLYGGPIGTTINAGIGAGNFIAQQSGIMGPGVTTDLNTMASQGAAIVGTLGPREAARQVLVGMANDGRATNPNANGLAQFAGGLTQTVGKLSLLGNHFATQAKNAVFGTYDKSLMQETYGN